MYGVSVESVLGCGEGEGRVMGDVGGGKRRCGGVKKCGGGVSVLGSGKGEGSGGESHTGVEEGKGEMWGV